jgi:hypothetical protein
MISTRRWLISVVASLLVGIAIGGALFAKSQPRSILALNHCDHCLNPADLAGLLGSAGVQRLGGHLPFAVFETEKSIALQYPFAKRPNHFVIVPKRDIKNLGEVSPDNTADIMDMIYTARYLIEKNHLRDYRFYTNGPAAQTVTYLHFHLVAK